MKQLLVLSGKGGTGKTTITSILITLLQAKKYADCDVDAPNLHLSMKPKVIPEKSDLYGMKKARIQVDECIQCGKCLQHCRFDAIFTKNHQYQIDPILCEGCSVCNLVCPVGAIELIPNINGTMYNYQSENSFFTTAELSMGSGNSGFLVSEVKEQLKFADISSSIEIIDGSPGIGCPVIASITGVDLVLIVAEPSISGFEDMKRVIETAKRMKVNVVVCVNKYNMNEEKTNQIFNYCQELAIPFVGKIPYDKEIAKVALGETILPFQSPAYIEIQKLATTILNYL